MHPQVVYVDVDDTLVRSVGTKRIPIPTAVERVRTLHRGGAILYLWSTGGADYARATAAELGLTELFTGFLPKPNIIIDDQEVHEWRGLMHERPFSQVTLNSMPLRPIRSPYVLLAGLVIAELFALV